ncbi:MAG: aldo/keto reductase [Lactobacillus sp.]|jgi:diketogulonate reductase-like aldo/keto reductase|nr:aldo/keto reductase [Lactobacillus sp.]
MGNTSVPSVQLANGVEIPQVGLGVFRIPDFEVAQKTVQTAFEVGYRHIDTASFYDNEAAVGAAIAASTIARKDIFVTSKLWNNVRGYDNVKRQFQVTLDKLQLTYLDMYLIHWPAPGYNEVWRAFEDLYDAGLIRAIGVSNFTPAQLTDLMNHARIKPMVDQIETHPYLQQTSDQVFLKAHHIIHEAWSPLGGENNGAHDLLVLGQTKAFTFSDHTHSVLTNPVLTAIAQKVGKTVAQVILRWHIQRGEVIIPKSVHKARLIENLAIFDFQLSPADMAAITTLDRQQRVGGDPNDADWLRYSMSYSTLAQRLANEVKQNKHQ